MRGVVIILLGAAISGQWSAATRLVQAEESVAAPPAAGASGDGAAALRSLRRSREALKSGVCRAKWKWSTETCQQDGTWKFFFDYDKGLSHVNREVATRIYASGATKGKEIRERTRVKRIDTPLEMIGYVDAVNVIWRQPPGDSAPANGEPFDIRTVGLIQLMSYKSRNATWKKWLDQIQREGPPEAFTEPNGNLRLEWDSGVRELKTDAGRVYESQLWRLWIDPARQFCPVRNEFWHGSGETKEFERGLVHLAEAEWKDMDGTMVPARCHWSMPRHQQEAELTFEWESVNSPVSGTVFTPEAMGAAPGTYVVRIVGEQSQIEYIIGQPRALDAPPPTTKSRRQPR